MITFEVSLPNNALNSWWALTKINKIDTYLTKISSVSDINKAVCLECLKPKTFEVNEYQNTTKYKDMPEICKQFFPNNGNDNIYVFNKPLFNKIKDLLILNPILLNGNIPQPIDAFYEKKPTGKTYIYGIYEYSEYTWVRTCPALYKLQDKTEFNGYPSDALPLTCQSPKIRLKSTKVIPSLPYCNYVAFSCVCDDTQILNRPLDRYGNPLFCHNNNYEADSIVLNANTQCPKQSYKCANIAPICRDNYDCNTKTFAAVNIYGTVISYDQNVPATARCPAGYFAESCENDIAVCKPCHTLLPGFSSPSPCQQDHFKCKKRCLLGEYGEYIGNNECVCKKCINSFEKPEQIFESSYSYKILNIGKNIKNPCYTRTLNQKRFQIDLLYSEENLYHILIDDRQIACVDNNTICNFGIPQDLFYPTSEKYGSYNPTTVLKNLTEYHTLMISNYISSLINLVNNEYFANIDLETCGKCNLIKAYLEGFNNFLHDIMLNLSVDPVSIKNHISNIFENPPQDSKLGYLINNQIYNSNENNLFIKMNYSPKSYFVKDKIDFDLSLYKGLSKENVCSAC